MPWTRDGARFLRFVALSAVALPVPLAAESVPPAHPFPQHVTYAPGSLTPNHRTQAQLDDDVRAAYWRWNANYLQQAGTESDGHPRFRVRTGSAPAEPTVSEGQGYGMTIVALMAGEDPDAQVVFDGLWEFFNDHRSEIDSRLMDWYVPADESPNPGSDDSAFDGDSDIAFALLIAERQWGNGGRVAYRSEFESVAAGIMASTIGPQSRLPELGDWVDPEGATFNQYTPRSSDLMPGHFRAFARATGDLGWNDVAAAAQQMVESLQSNHSPATGLLPDFVVPVSVADHTPQPAAPSFLEGPHDGHFYYNAGRDPWRLAVDALLNADPQSALESRRMSSWVRTAAAGDPANIKGGYELDGTVIGNYFTSFFAAPFGVAAMADATAQQWLDDVYDSVRGREEGYFEDSVSLLCILVMTRNFWDPTRVDLLFSDGFESGDTAAWIQTIR